MVALTAVLGAATASIAEPEENGPERYNGANGAEVRVDRGHGCAGTTMVIDSGWVDDSTEDLSSGLTVAVDENCGIRIIDQHSGVPVASGIDDDAGASVSDEEAEAAEVSDTTFEANTL